LIIIIVVAVLVVISAVVINSLYGGKDITITSLTIPTSGVHGQNITVNPTIRNRGLVNTGNFSVNYYLTPKKNVNNRIFLGVSTINNLNSRGSESPSIQLNIPSNVTPGTYYILAFADPTKQVKELNEDNNYKFSNTNIVIS
jgi:subtilase family serine protease